jgi:hypothetical protein
LKLPANQEAYNERGLRFMGTFMDEVHHNQAGNEITLLKRRK